MSEGVTYGAAFSLFGSALHGVQIIPLPAIRRGQCDGCVGNDSSTRKCADLPPCMPVVEDKVLDCIFVENTPEKLAEYTTQKFSQLIKEQS